VKQHKWHKQEAASFLDGGDVPADAVGDLTTHQNLLSVWEISDDLASIERAVRAVAVGRDKIQPMGYMIFDANLLPAEIEVRTNIGTSPDKAANPWHRDLALSGNKLVALTRLMLQSGESGSVLKHRLEELVQQGVRDGDLPSSVLA
jgi:hypothetical protein